MIGGAMKRFACSLTTLICFLGLVACSDAENFVGYRVSTSCSADWDIAVNGAKIVRHRPTGFGRCLYSGSINRAVSNGWNSVSLIKSEKVSHKPEEEECISFEIDYIHNYTGQRDFDNPIPVIRYMGSTSTNMVFKIDGDISKITRGTMRRPGVRNLTESLFFYVGLTLYIIFVNIYGFIMVLNDRQAAKKRLPRIPAARFIWNAIFGGGIGTLLGVISRKHDMDKTISVVVIPAVILIQFGLVAFTLSSAGRQFLNRVNLGQPTLHGSSVFGQPASFLRSLKRTDDDFTK